MKDCRVIGCRRDTSKGGQGYCSMHWTRIRRHGSVGPVEPVREQFSTLAERFWAKVDTSGECWIWTASLNSYGYGQISMGVRPIVAHRVSWFLENGSYPPAELELDHLCRNRACVRPAHLEAVTRRTNFLRGEHPTAVAFRNGTCQHGHPMTEENVYVRPGGKRECRKCMRETARRTRLRQKAAV